MLYIRNTSRLGSPKRYSLLVIFNNGAESYQYYSHSPQVIENKGREFRKEFGKEIRQMFVFDNTLGIKIKRMKVNVS